MQYHNPFQLFAVEPAELEPKLAAIEQDIRQRLQHIADDAEIVAIRNQRLRKGEWLFWLGQLAEPEKLAAHLEIAARRPLANFLEFGHLGFFEQPVDTEFWGSAAAQFVRPFFIFQYAEALLQALKTQNERDMELLQRLPFELTQAEFDSYFGEISAYLTRTATDLKALSENQALTYLSERELMSHLPDTTINVYNYLPQQLSGVRNWIGDAVGRIAMYMSVQLGRPDGAIALVRQALKLKLDESLRRDLEQLLTTHKSRNRTPAWILIGVAAVLLLFFLKYLENRL